MRNNKIINEDLNNIYDGLTDKEKSKFNNATVLLTGCGGFLGYYFVHFLTKFKEQLKIKQVIALENFLTGNKEWLDEIVEEYDFFSLHEFNIITDDISEVPGAENANLIIHMASIASPTFYRIYPVETIDANITGLRRLFDYYLNKKVTGFLFFSSSEIYGDPFKEYIPTPESYRGNVNTMGPRACYDEAKRFGETMCWIFNNQYNFPVTIARPFNNYGPGMSIHDKRLPADFAKCVVEGDDLNILSDGKPTRTFCYISDAITGYLKVLLYDKFDVFNIGIDNPEISVKEFAEIYVKNAKDIFGYTGKVTFGNSDDDDYMTDNPNRRCPVIDKAKELLGYNPSIHVEEGIARFLEFLKIYNGQLL
ncbi:NAD-dependent epimerase/dehydratase family protein [Neotamlana sargassicola]|nr:NAD-dependent epimerase/dehydratase family protein [Tamlana sargassicola]